MKPKFQKLLIILKHAIFHPRRFFAALFPDRKSQLIAAALIVTILVSGYLTFSHLVKSRAGAQHFGPDREEMRLTAERQDWRVTESPTLEAKYDQRGVWLNIWDHLTFPFHGRRAIKVELIGFDKRIIENFQQSRNYQISHSVEGFKIKVLPVKELSPGRYTLRASWNDRGREYRLEQDFSWGLLGINVNKSMYFPGEAAWLQMAVLDEKGDTLCDAELALEINGPGGEYQVFQTDGDPISKKEIGSRIERSDSCGPQTVTDKPDYWAMYQIPQKAGTYKMNLTARTANGEYKLSDSFEVKDDIPYDVERTTATRIYPLAKYNVKIKVKANRDFRGDIREETALSFELSDISGGGQVEDNELTRYIIWPVDLKKGQEIELAYTYDAPDVSPYVFYLGKLQFTRHQNFFQKIIHFNFSANRVIWQEARQWQIASDQVANMLLFWDLAAGSVPSSWTCVSCDTTAPFYGRMIRGNNVYGGTGGSDTHAHPNPGTLTSTTAPATNLIGTNKAPNISYSHSHTTTVASGLTAPNLPPYQSLLVIKYANGVPSQIPANAIGIFTGTTVPSGWSQVYTTSSPFLRGNGSVGTGGTETHTHSVVLNTTSADTSGGKYGAISGPNIAGQGHTHNDSSGTSASTLTDTPPYVTVNLGKNGTAPVAVPTGIIAMFDASPPAGTWTAKSDSGGDLYQRFPKSTGSYGTTGVGTTHVHTNVTITSGTTPTYGSSGSGATNAIAANHTHQFTVPLTSTGNTVPAYQDVIFSQASSSPVPDLHQAHYHWRNDNGVETAATEFVGQDTAPTSFPSNQHKRLRLEISNEGSATAENYQYRLEYGLKTTSCANILAGTWTDVGAANGDWDMYDSTHITNGSNATDISNAIGGVTNENTTFLTPNSALLDTSSTTPQLTLNYENFLEAEYSVKPNVTSGAYCFRLTNNGDSTNFDYANSPATYAEATVTEANPLFNLRRGIFENDENNAKINNGSTVKIGQRIRVRIQIDTNADWLESQKVLKLQFSKNGGTYEDVRPAGEIRPAQSILAKGERDIGGPETAACPSGTTWNPRKVWNKNSGRSKVGAAYEARAVTDPINLPASTCDEISFLVDTKNATPGAEYMFHLVNVTDDADLTNYYDCPTFKAVTADNNTQRASMANTTNLPSGTNPDAYADLVNLLDQQGYSNEAADDSAREILQSVAPKTGSGVTAASADVIAAGEAASDQFGYSVASAGDVNGDGYADIIVGAYGANAGGTDRGRAYVFHGGSGLVSENASSADVILAGEANDNRFGYSVASAGDVSGDGYPDVIVGADGYTTGNANRGRAYVFYGGSGLVSENASAADVILAGEDNNDYFGISVASAGDVSGDGYPDLIVGAYGYIGVGNRGRAYVFYGGSGLVSENASAADVILAGEDNGDQFGISVASAGDVSGDGYPEVIVGANTYSAGGNRGRAYIFYGGSGLVSENASAADVILAGEVNGDYFGNSVASAGDVNGDGYADVIMGASYYSGEAARGRAYIFYGGSGLVSENASAADVILAGEVNGDYFGTSVASAGDVNGDGYADIIVGANGYTTGNANRGRAYIFYGGSGLVSENASNADVILAGENNGDFFGISVASAGDVNGDGYPDVIVGAKSASSNGRAYIFEMSYQMNNTADKIVTGEAASDLFGYSVASAGDVNGDGYADIIVGAYGYTTGNANRGRAYLFWGGPMANILAGSAPVILAGQDSDDQFGRSVASAGDVNGDGYADIIVGAFGYATGGNTGRAYVFYGGSGLVSKNASAADVILAGEASGDFFGRSVASAGDANGDGYADIIVGAYGYTTGNANRGRAYVFYGGSGLVSENASAADVILAGEASGDYFGYSVASAGDVSGDGYPDVIVGAYVYTTGNANRGRAYVFYGGSGLVSENASSADVILAGELNGDYFGYSVASAGDVSGDGYADVIVGAAGYSAGENRGRAYVFYGGSDLVSENASAADVILAGEASGDYFGTSVASAGDVSGDGYPDVIVGAYGYTTGNANRGRAYIFYGGSGLISENASSADVILAGEANSDYFGTSVASAGDVSGDGYADVIVGARGYSGGAYTGRAYTYLGGGSSFYPVFNFANKSPTSCGSLSSITATWIGDSSVSPGTKQLKLQVYHFNGSSSVWEDVDTESNPSPPYLEITLTGSVTSSLSQYCDGSNWSYWRVYQDTGTTNILRTDLFQIGPIKNTYQLEGTERFEGTVIFQ